jgi:hypothetical protein
VLSALSSDARAVAAAGLLLALPGVLVVRSPWRAMPLLSLAFWVLSWSWLPASSRTRALHVLLIGFAALGVLRLLRPGPLPRPGLAQGLLALAALALVFPLALWPLAPGAHMPLDSLAALLLAWRDGWPASFEPLLPVPRFQASGLATLAADVILLSGAPAHRAALVVMLASQAALLLALWSLAATYRAPGRATLIAVAATLGAGAPLLAGPGALAVALGAQAAALWRDRRGAASAFAAGACLAAGVAADVTTASCAVAMIAAGAGFGRVLPTAGAEGRRRARIAWLTALVLAVPLALRPPPLRVPSPAPLVALALVLVLCHVDRRAPRYRRWVTAAAVAVTIVAVARAVATTSAARDAVTAGEIAAMEWIRDHTRPLAVVCAPPRPAARWIPSLAERRTTVPVASGWPAARGECEVWIQLAEAAPPGRLPSLSPALRTPTAAVWTTSQNR